jgi:MFS family permease
MMDEPDLKVKSRPSLMTDQKESRAFKKITIAIAMVTSFGSAYMFSAVNIALPVMGAHFAMSSVMLGWVTTSALVTTAMLMVPIGRLADIYGRKRIFIYGLIFQFFSTLFCGLANSGALIILTRIIQGVSASMIFGTMVAIVTSVFPGDERGKALGISVAATYAGLAVGPFLGGLFTHHLGWRSIFFFGTFMTTVALGFALSKMKKEWIEAAGEKFDLTGSLVFATSLGLLIYGFITLPELAGFLFVAIGLIGVVAFVWFEGKIESPVLNIGVLRRNTVFIFSNVATMINYSATFALTFLLSLYLQYVQGYSPQQAGAILLINPGAMSVFATIAGRLSDRFQPQIIAAMGLGLSCATMVLLSSLDEASGLPFILALLFFNGLAAALFSSPNTNAVMSSVGKNFLGVAAGTQGTTRTVGMVFSMGIVMILFTLHMGGAQITPEQYPAFLSSMKAGFAIFAILSFVGIFCQLAGRKKWPKAGNNNAGP